MKFINYLTSIENVGIFPVISFLIFFLFFLVLGIYAFSADKNHMQKLSNLPFDKKEKNNR